MYESPINLIYEQMATNIARKIDKEVIEQTMKVGINVDRDEMIKALKYDRGQYDKGYADGLEAGKSKWISVEDELPETVIECTADGEKWFNSEKVLAFTNDGEIKFGYFADYPDYSGWEEAEYGHDMKVEYWMPLPESPGESDVKDV